MSDDEIKRVNEAKNISSSRPIGKGAQQPVSLTPSTGRPESEASAKFQVQVACCFASAAGGKLQV